MLRWTRGHACTIVEYIFCGLLCLPGCLHILCVGAEDLCGLPTPPAPWALLYLQCKIVVVDQRLAPNADKE